MPPIPPRLGLTLFLCTAVAVTIRAAPPASRPASYADIIRSHTTAVLNQLESDHDFDAAEKSLRGIFDETVLYCPDSSRAAIVYADFPLRLVRHLKNAPADQRPELLRFLRANPNLASALVFVIRPGMRVGKAYALLDKLRNQRGQYLDKYATLTAAICVVHAEPLEYHFNENKTRSPDPLALFDYFVVNEPRMLFGIRNVPSELLEHVVDTTSSIDDLAWALKQFAGNRDVGRLFFNVEYDYDSYTRGTPKKITQLGYTLPNILKYGGVCVDQAFFASEVGKAIGVPTEVDFGESASLSHAWVGFLQADSRGAHWNFDEGRYPEYQVVRGNASDPATRKKVPDAYISLLAELVSTTPDDRYTAVALTDAAHRLIDWHKSGDTPKLPPPNGTADVRPAPRNADVPTALALIESALRQSVGYEPAWFTVRDLATDNQLSLDDKRRWADVLLKLGAKRYPDFTLAILSPMVATIDDPDEQDRLWATLFPVFQSRADLAANIRMQEAAMWEAKGEPAKAGLCYLDVVNRYANAGPFIISALKGAEKSLVKDGHPEHVLQLYAQSWSHTQLPAGVPALWLKESNWYRVGKMYAQKLKKAGDSAPAQKIEAELEKATASPGAR